MPGPSLCSVCLDCLVNHRGLRRQIRDFDESVYDHHDSFDSLQISANAGCAICTDLWTKRHPQLVITGERPLTNIKISWSPSIELTARYEDKAVDPEYVGLTPLVVFLLRRADGRFERSNC
jgi:hypothetical protein